MTETELLCRKFPSTMAEPSSLATWLAAVLFSPRLATANAYQHFPEQALAALYRTGKSCSNYCKSAGSTGLQQGDRHEARHRDRGNHEARGHRDPLRLSRQ